MPELAPSVASVIENLLKLNVDPTDDFLSTPANTAWSIAACLSALAKVKSWKGEVDGWIGSILKGYSWNSHVLGGLVGISSRW
jgi:hypothetical protein